MLSRVDFLIGCGCVKNFRYVQWFTGLGCLLLAGHVGAASSQPSSPAAFFEDTRIWDLRLTVSPGDHDRLDPGRGRGFEYVPATVTLAGQVLERVGLRYKGNSSFSTARGIPKKSFKIDFNRFEKGQTFLGLAKLNFNNNVLDPSQLREVLAYRLWRQLGLPASRTTFARVTLQVPGRHDGQLLGLYVVVEQVNRDFLRDRFGSDQGLLLKPEGGLEVPYLGEVMAPYERVYVPKTETSSALMQRLMDFTRLVHRADDATFSARVASFVHLGDLARFTAAHVALSHLDSFLLRGHNFYLYLPEPGGRLTWLPWDLNSTFAGHRSAGSPEQQYDLSVTHPFAPGHRLLERLMSLKSFRDPFQQALKAMAEGPFSVEGMADEMAVLRDAVEATVREDPYTDYPAFVEHFEPIKEVPAKHTPGGFRVIRKPLLRVFMTRRHASMRAQWAGERKGYVPGRGRRPGRSGKP